MIWFFLACAATDPAVHPSAADAGATDAADSGSSDSGSSDSGSDTGETAAQGPSPPPELTRWLSGDDADADTVPLGPGLILMGGGAEPDAAFDWWRPLLAGGDVVVLRVSGDDGYNAYLFDDIGGVDSVETLRVDTAALANDPYVAWRVNHAEGVFIAGGDQWDYLRLWSGTPLQGALRAMPGRGAVLGGTSAGLAVLGDRVFSAERGSVYSDEALEDPYHPTMRFADEFLDLPPLVGVITDSHFTERDRLGRLVAFVARMWVDGIDAPTGVGVDEGTALLLGPEGRRVVGPGAVTTVSADHGPTVCEPGTALVWSGVLVTRQTDQDETISTVTAANGRLTVVH